MRKGFAMKPEGEVGLFREECEISEFLTFRASSEIDREVAFAVGFGASLNRDGLSKIAFCGVEDSHIAKKPFDNSMFRPRRILQDGQRPSKQRLGLRILAPVSVENRKIFDGMNDKGMLRPKRFLPDGQRPFIK